MTSRILVVDLLSKDIPVELITGLVVLHAEKWERRPFRLWRHVIDIYH